MHYLDANFFIIAVMDNTRRGDSARRLLDTIIHGEDAATSVLALNEVMWALIRNGKKHLVAKMIDHLYRMQSVTIHGVPAHAALQALPLLDKLAPRDALHVVMMRELGCDTIVTDDADFDKIDGIARVKQFQLLLQRRHGSSCRSHEG